MNFKNHIISIILRSLICFTFLFLNNSHLHAQTTSSHAVQVAGAMKNVMWKGELQGIIQLDTISQKKHLYGIGPQEYLKGEILILDGRSYLSKVVTPKKMKVEETFQIKAPFFVYSQVDKWITQKLPDSISNMKQFEQYLYQIAKSSKHPFAFRLSGTIHSALIHIVNLPEGSAVREPDDAHKGQVNFVLKNKVVDIVGFFSTIHQSIFTHHDTFLHMHLITANRKKMGHVDRIQFKKGMVLYLPAEY
jgi:acetolactate decarboxylase